MNYSNYLKMSSQELEAEITKQRQKIKNINEQITLLKKLKVAAEVSEKEQNTKNEKQQTDKIEKPQNQHVAPQQPQQPKPTVNPTTGGMTNGTFRKIHG